MERPDNGDWKTAALVKTAEGWAGFVHTDLENRFPVVSNLFTRDEFVLLMTVASAWAALVSLSDRTSKKEFLAQYDQVGEDLERLDERAPVLLSSASAFTSSHHKPEEPQSAFQAFGVWTVGQLLGRAPNSEEEWSAASMVGSAVLMAFGNWFSEP